MSANPIELIGGLANTDDVVKADLIAWAKSRVPQVMESAAEINNTNLAGQLIVMVNDLGTFYYLDPTDTTSPDNPPEVIVSLDNKRFKPLSSVPFPTTGSLGGVYSSAAVPNQFLTGVGADGHVTREQPSATDLSDGVTGTGAVVRSNAPNVISPTGIVKADVGLGNVDNTSNATERAAVRTLTNASISGSANTITNLTTAMFATNVVDTDGTLTANSDTRIASQKAVKSYVDSVAQGLDPKPSVRAATTVNITLSAAQTIDGVSIVAGDRVLVKNQSTASQNGIYVCAAGSWTRALDFDAWAELPGAFTFVEGGTVNGTTGWTCNVAPGGTIGSTSVTFTQFSGAGSYTASTGLTLTGTAFSIDSSVVTLTGGQTLTSKVLTAPDINGGTVDNITSFGIRSSGAAFDLQMLSSEVLTGNRALTWVLGNAARTITLGGSPTLNGGTHSGTNTGDQTITLTGDITGTGTGSFATAIGANKVTLGMMTTIATATFLGRTTASTGNVEALTATQATALLNAMVGDTGSGGTKGLVPAPGAGDAAAGKFLKADGSYAVPAGGGGGGMTDSERQNFLLTAIYQSKSFAEYRRLVNMFATGFKGASDALNGILTGSSSNYTVTPGTAGATTGNVAPTSTAGSDQTATHTAATTSGNTASASSELAGNFQAWRAFDKVIANPSAGQGTWISNSTTTGWLQYQFGSAKTISSYTLTSPANSLQARMASAWTLKGSNTGSFAGEETTLDTRSSQTAWSSAGETRPYTIASPGSFTYYRLTVTANNGDATFLEIDEMTLTSAASTNNMTLVTVAQTADFSVSNGRVLVEFDNTASPALNTDLTVEVTCNGGTNWASATLSAVTSSSQGSRKVAETADTACTSGTDFRVRIKTLNNKNVPIYGVSLSVH